MSPPVRSPCPVAHHVQSAFLARKLWLVPTMRPPNPSLAVNMASKLTDARGLPRSMLSKQTFAVPSRR